MEKMTYIDRLMSKNSNYDENTDTIVPDLYPDIAKIVMITGKPFIKDTNIQNDRVLISGEVKCEVLYIPETLETPVKMIVSLSFAHIEELKDKDCSIFCNISISEIQARIINPRKISVLASICLSTNQYKKNTINAHQNNFENCETLINTKEITLIDTVNICECILSDTVEFQGLLNSDSELFGIKPNVIINDIKLLKNKLMLRGNIEFCGYCIENETFSQLNASSPFSQILDITITDEKLDSDIDILIQNFDLEQTNGTEFAYTLGLKICLIQKRPQVIQIVEDIYDTNCEIEIKKTDYSLMDTPKHQIENYEFAINIPCENIVDNVNVIEIFPYISQSKDNIYDLFANIHGIYTSGDKMFDFTINHKFAENMPYTLFDYINIRANKSTNNVIEAFVNLKAQKYCDSKIILPIIDEITKTDDKIKQNDEIILKFINTPQSIWQIAKQYSVKKVDILDANQMDCNTETIENIMILIPKK